MDTEETFFLALKNHRESKQISLDEISEYTKINPKYLNAIEEGTFDIIPNVYMRLFIRSYAMYIGADANQTLADYELYTTGTIQPKLLQENKSETSYSEKNNSSDSINSYEEDFQVNYKQVLKIVAVILSIFIAFMILKFISKDTNTTDQSSVNSSIVVIPADSI